MKFGPRVRQLRLKLGLSARTLGKMAGMKSGAHISLIENGRRVRLQSSTTKRLAAALGVTRDYLESLIEHDLAELEAQS